MRVLRSLGCLRCFARQGRVRCFSSCWWRGFCTCLDASQVDRATLTRNHLPARQGGKSVFLHASFCLGSGLRLDQFCAWLQILG